MEVILSPHNKKKWQVAIPFEGKYKKVTFGQMGSEDYTMHKDPERQRLYLARHRTRENWDDPHTAGYWSRWLLWNKPSMSQAIRAMRPKGFNVRRRSE